MITYTPGSYDYCPRGSGNASRHYLQGLRHVIVEGRLHCMAEELIWTIDQQHLAALKALDERCKGA